MAHLQHISVPRCYHSVCNRPATEELFNSRNAPMGKYCRPHAEKALAEQKTHEERVGFDNLPRQ